MFISELYDLSQLPVEQRVAIEQALPRAREVTNTDVNVKRFIEMQESFASHINSALENCCVYIMPMYELAAMKCATDSPILVYTRCQLTGHQVIMMAEEALAIEPEGLECLLYHELVHAEQDVRGDMKPTDGSIIWKGQEYSLADLGLKVQAAVEAYMTQGHDYVYASVIANSEVMPWECEAYYKMFEYTLRFKQYVNSVPDAMMKRLTELYRNIA